MKWNHVIAIALTACTLGLAACQKPKQVQPDTTTRGPVTEETIDDASTSGLGADATADAGAMSEAQRQALAALQSRNVILFDYDSSEIPPEYDSTVAAHATYLNQYGTSRLRLEGHTDERGSREYNIGLGERRAQTVRRALMLQGVKEAQITTVSYGEERPAADGSDEKAYAQNRRVELVQAP